MSEKRFIVETVEMIFGYFLLIFLLHFFYSQFIKLFFQTF